MNPVGDLATAITRHDYRKLLGLPLGGAMMLYLASARVTEFFKTKRPVR